MSSALDDFTKTSLEITASDIIYDEEIDFVGRGQFGSVYRAQIKGLNVAVKVSHETKFSADQLKSFVTEMDLMKKCHHPNVVLFIGISIDSGRVMLITELLAGDLAQLIHHRDESLHPEIYNCVLTTELKLNIIEQCCKGVQWLHNGMNLIHRDIKPANFLIDTSFHVKVCDFGFAEIDTNQSGQAKGSPLYCAPEVWEKKCEKAVDVYALAITMWELFYERLPFEEFLKDPDKFRTFIANKGRPILPNTFEKGVIKKGEEKAMVTTLMKIHQKYGDLAKVIPDYIEKVMECAWEHDPTKRIDINKMVDMIDEAKLSYTLGKKSASAWWKKYFSYKGNDIETTVPVSDFIAALKETHGIKDFDQYIAEQVLSDNNEVSTTFFGHLIHLFGVFYKSKDVFKSMIETIQSDWFFNTFTKDQSQAQLEGRVDGTFLIRISTTDPKYPFTLTKRTNGKTTHSRIECVSPSKDKIKFILSSKTKVYEASSLKELVDVMRKNNFVKEACPREEKLSEY
ncbi:serine/threonine protein kinase, putative [Entamoeba dispar SAW760]|uniref:Serine/threonine protein kinase, putative n=1 Tax=Entamoeba dispar (strain ATCC PRA-260 / SAW760) TaxID=370354 RepID=B0EA56_ENTDS|nr:serine/threonine protein kinase, putative [Entamoeba dispar SAW760]EDR28602.1 serine/threonine protein kinase, putative [Entamoeba dispar SAW760]|eukprot:EDR28602.1 serine/threonine protein kinase, putative [Entamoeba dispar SAW760]